MSRQSQMPGMTYQIVSQNAQQAVMEYTYFCPSPDYDRLETGGFFDSLICSECEQTADVRFWKTMKIE